MSEGVVKLLVALLSAVLGGVGTYLLSPIIGSQAEQRQLCSQASSLASAAARKIDASGELASMIQLKGKLNLHSEVLASSIQDFYVTRTQIPNAGGTYEGKARAIAEACRVMSTPTFIASHIF